MVNPDRPIRADAQRNRDRIVDVAGELLAQRGADVQMEQIADRAGIGVATVYRHFATKQALLEFIVARRFTAVSEAAATAVREVEPGQAFEALLRTYLDSASSDAAFRYATVGPEDISWEALAPTKDQFMRIAEHAIASSISAGTLRSDFTFGDFVLITRGILVNMGRDDLNWRRHLELILTGPQAPHQHDSRTP